MAQAEVLQGQAPHQQAIVQEVLATVCASALRPSALSTSTPLALSAQIQRLWGSDATLLQFGSRAGGWLVGCLLGPMQFAFSLVLCNRE